MKILFLLRVSEIIFTISKGSGREKVWETLIYTIILKLKYDFNIE